MYMQMDEKVGCTLFVEMFIFCQNKFNRCSLNFCFWNSHIMLGIGCKQWADQCFEQPKYGYLNLPTGFHFFYSLVILKMGDTYCSILSGNKRFSVFEPIYGRMWSSLRRTFELDESSSRLGVQ